MSPRFARPTAALALAGLFASIAAAPARAETTFRLGTIAPEGSTYMRELRSFSGEVERLSGGELRFKWLSSGRLGDDVDEAKMMSGADAKIDGGALTGIGLATLDPDLRVWSLPGLFQDYDEVEYIERKYRDRFAKGLEERGFVLLFFGETGFSYVLSDEPVTSMEAVHKRKLWMWADDDSGQRAMQLSRITFFKSSLGELADLLRDGKVPTWIFPPLAVLAMTIEAYAKYVNDLRWNFIIAAMVVRKDVFDALPEDQQRLLKAVGRKWEPRVMQAWRAANEKALVALLHQGSKWVEFPDAEKQKYFQECAEQRPVLAKEYGIEKITQEVSEDLRDFRAVRRQHAGGGER